MNTVNWTALIVFLALFALVTWLGFASARWRRGNLDDLHEWGLGGRRFGTVVSWFLIGGDLYTAYTFIAVPALAFGAGAIAFFAVPYTIIAYPILFVVFPRMWNVCHKRGYLTAADFVTGRFGNRWLGLAIAATGILATMPYIALQLVGIQVVVGALGISGDLPLIIAFAVLAAFTFSSGLRAPASIAIVKDILIYVTAFVAVIVIPIRMGGFGAIFAAIPKAHLLLPVPGPHTTGLYGVYATLAFGSALALFMYPHAMTGILAASSSKAIRRNSVIIPAYSVMLGLLTLLGVFAAAAGLAKLPEFGPGFKEFAGNFAVPALFLHFFPSWFVGIAFAAVGIGALVPSAIMAIAAANLYTRNIHGLIVGRAPEGAQEARIAKWVSLLVKLGALAFILFLPLQYAIQFQLLGGIWMIQTVPAVMLGVFTRWFDDLALLIGWAVGMVMGTWMAAAMHFGPAYVVHIAGWALPGYTALFSLIANLAVTIVLTLVLRTMRGEPRDATLASDYVP
ncbi:MAG: sodium:solute symporter [Rhodospirillales bacterium]|nr:sodium:solute symporter [Rhodospirillales bacterium]